ncbi:MAG: hypothetical protein ACYS8W_11770 [Planctomycetota bacterium]|jgi:hypothetical protein
MRTAGVVIGVVILAIGAAFLFDRAGKSRVAERGGADYARRMSALEQKLDSIQSRLENLEKTGGIEWEKADISESPPPSAEDGDEPEAGDTDDSPATSGDDMGEQVDTPAGGRDWLRRTIRDEVKAMEEEKKKKAQEDMKARQPEEWEKEEFKELAWQIHNNGGKLDMTDNQKRQYYTILKEDKERTRGLWNTLKEENPDAGHQGLGNMYNEQLKEINRTTREMVSGILNATQREKYEKLCKESKWFK